MSVWDALYLALAVFNGLFTLGLMMERQKFPATMTALTTSFCTFMAFWNP